MELEIKQYGIYWIGLDPTTRVEVNKTRPCVVVSPDELNNYLKTVIIAPLTTTTRSYPSRVPCLIKGKKGSIMLDQVRTIDKTRIGDSLGSLGPKEVELVKSVLIELFC